MDVLSEREREVLRLLGRGLTNAEISEVLVVSVPTAKTHVANVLAKLGLRDRVQAAIFAHEHGHYVLEHRSSSPQVEMEANAQAVEILVRVRRVDELQALTAFHGYLLSVHRSQASRGVLPGHASACQEIADLVRRYPKHETVTRTWECAK